VSNLLAWPTAFATFAQRCGQFFAAAHPAEDFRMIARIGSLSA
jgi:hypothetical protein